MICSIQTSANMVKVRLFIIVVATFIEQVRADGHRSCSGFECEPGNCIPFSWQCDDIDDCADIRDEKNCDQADICEGFQCARGGCTEPRFVCDDYIDCIDGSDELDCEETTIEISTSTSKITHPPSPSTTSTSAYTRPLTTPVTTPVVTTSTTTSSPPVTTFSAVYHTTPKTSTASHETVTQSNSEETFPTITKPDSAEHGSGETTPTSSGQESLEATPTIDGSVEATATQTPTDSAEVTSTPESDSVEETPTPTEKDTRETTGRDSIEEPTKLPNVCDDDTIQCHNTSQCIPSYYICDKIQDCADGWDELNCKPPCKGFECDDGKCIAYSWQCDGIPDCQDERDERNCDTGVCVGYQCLSSDCTSPNFPCDGINDCDDSSDEQFCSQDFKVKTSRRLTPDILDIEQIVGNKPIKREVYSEYESVSNTVFIKKTPLPEGYLTHIVFYTVNNEKTSQIEVRNVSLQLWERMEEASFKLAMEWTVPVVLTAEGKAVTVAIATQPLITASNNAYLGWTFGEGNSGVISYDQIEDNEDERIDVWKNNISNLELGQEYELDTKEIYPEIYSIGVKITTVS